MDFNEISTILFVDALLAREDGTFEKGNLLIDTIKGQIISEQELFYKYQKSPDKVIHLNGFILAPGFIDVQINGAYGVDFSHYDENDENYIKNLNFVSKKIVETGITSFVPTVITQKSDFYQKLLTLLSPRSFPNSAHILGYHAEGPFLFPEKRGIHDSPLLLEAIHGINSWCEVYSSECLSQPGVKIITAAPDVQGVLECIEPVTKMGVTFSIGHSNADISLASKSVELGALLVTHLFNAMSQLHHRDPGVIGLLGKTGIRPYYGLITDGIHVHSNVIRIAYNSHPNGCIIVTDAMSMMDPNLPDGIHSWRGNRDIIKQGNRLLLEGTSTLAGSCISMDEAVRNFSKFTNSTLAESIRCCTYNPAQMLGKDIAKRKGHLKPGGDADLVILSTDGYVQSTWVTGKCVYKKT